MGSAAAVTGTTHRSSSTTTFSTPSLGGGVGGSRSDEPPLATESEFEAFSSISTSASSSSSSSSSDMGATLRHQRVLFPTAGTNAHAGARGRSPAATRTARPASSAVGEADPVPSAAAQASASASVSESQLPPHTAQPPPPQPQQSIAELVASLRAMLEGGGSGHGEEGGGGRAAGFGRDRVDDSDRGSGGEGSSSGDTESTSSRENAEQGTPVLHDSVAATRAAATAPTMMAPSSSSSSDTTATYFPSSKLLLLSQHRHRISGGGGSSYSGISGRSAASPFASTFSHRKNAASHATTSPAATTAPLHGDGMTPYISSTPTRGLSSSGSASRGGLETPLAYPVPRSGPPPSASAAASTTPSGAASTILPAPGCHANDAPFAGEAEEPSIYAYVPHTGGGGGSISNGGAISGVAAVPLSKLRWMSPSASTVIAPGVSAVAAAGTPAATAPCPAAPMDAATATKLTSIAQLHSTSSSYSTSGGRGHPQQQQKQPLQAQPLFHLRPRSPSQGKRTVQWGAPLSSSTSDGAPTVGAGRTARPPVTAVVAATVAGRGRVLRGNGGGGGSGGGRRLFDEYADTTPSSPSPTTPVQQQQQQQNSAAEGRFGGSLRPSKITFQSALSSDVRGGGADVSMSDAMGAAFAAARKAGVFGDTVGLPAAPSATATATASTSTTLIQQQQLPQLQHQVGGWGGIFNSRISGSSGGGGGDGCFDWEGRSIYEPTPVPRVWAFAPPRASAAVSLAV